MSEQRGDFRMTSNIPRYDQSQSLPYRQAIPRIKGAADDENEQARKETILELERFGAERVRGMLAKGEIRRSRLALVYEWLKGK